MSDILRQVRQLKLTLRKNTQSQLTGAYRSAFKGTGLELSEVRLYHYGDDIRSIDWNVTARMGQPYVKVFEEDRELNVMLLFDVSGSQYFIRKFDTGLELSAILGFSALQNQDRFGVLAYSEAVELYIRPAKGRNHLPAIVERLQRIQPRFKGTHLRSGLQFLGRTQQRRSLMFIVSDFLDTDYEPALLRLHQKHELVLIRLYHPAERLGTVRGIVPIRNLETGRLGWIWQRNAARYDQLQQRFSELETKLERFSRRYKIDCLHLDVSQPYIQRLLAFFQHRPFRRT